MAAASRVSRVVALASTSAADAAVDREAGRLAARRALLIEGDARLDGPALVVELEPEVGMAAGRLSQLPGEWFQAAVPDAEVLPVRRRARSIPTLELGGRQLVVIARDAHRHEWEREAIEALTSRADDAIGDRDRPSALATTCGSGLRRDPRSGPRERGSGRRGAILGPTPRGGAVR